MNQRICHITTMPIPKVGHMDAHLQEIELLIQEFGGECFSVYPFQVPKPHVPAALYGVRQLRRLRRVAREADIIQVWSTEFTRYPFLKLLPAHKVIYTVMTGWSPSQAQRIRFKSVVLHDPTALVDGELDTTIFVASPPMSHVVRHHLPIPDLEAGFHVLMASAPWTKKQFESKGVYALLEALEILPWLHLTFLWRGLHVDYMRQLISSHPARHRVQLIDEEADILQLQSASHATVLLAKTHRIIKHYPHSLIEALQSGRPVLLSSAVGMSSDVLAQGTGVVVEDVTTTQAVKGLTALKADYHEYVERVRRLPTLQYSVEAYLEFYGRLYDS